MKENPFNNPHANRTVVELTWYSYVLPDNATEDDIEKAKKVELKSTIFANLILLFLTLIILVIWFFARDTMYWPNMALFTAFFFYIFWPALEKAYAARTFKSLKVESKKNKDLRGAIISSLLIIVFSFRGAYFGIIDLEKMHFERKEDWTSALKYQQILCSKNNPIVNRSHCLFDAFRFKKMLGDEEGANDDYQRFLVANAERINKYCTKPKVGVECYREYHFRGRAKKTMDDYCSAKEDFDKFLHFYDNSPKLQKDRNLSRDNILNDIKELEQKCN